VSLGGLQVYAMCAIDALGLPFMLGTDAVITSTDPHNREPIQVTIVDRGVTFRPPGTVVVYAATAAIGRSVDTCCSTINFFTSPDSAQAWIAAHPLSPPPSSTRTRLSLWAATSSNHYSPEQPTTPRCPRSASADSTKRGPPTAVHFTIIRAVHLNS
jgi:hypothetical protein